MLQLWTCLSLWGDYWSSLQIHLSRFSYKCNFTYLFWSWTCTTPNVTLTASACVGITAFNWIQVIDFVWGCIHGSVFQLLWTCKLLSQYPPSTLSGAHTLTSVPSVIWVHRCVMGKLYLGPSNWALAGVSVASALFGDEWSALRPGQFTHSERSQIFNLGGGSVNPTTSKGAWKEANSRLYRDSTSDRSVLQSVTSCCTLCN
jgi:hypothetical protein